MIVKEAVARAKSYVTDLYSDEQLADLGLEEVEYDRGQHIWSVTLGFSRPWNTPGLPGGLGTIRTMARKRTFKVVRIADDGQIISLRNRETADESE